ncbi:MAG: endonuclease MutS2 [Lachnospiraceae bacterium]|nr:endonuclease MutS2 [Lachnospiraceae bacterium]
MNAKVLKTLEYNSIIDLLIEKADSEPGKKLCRELKPMTEIHEIEEAQTNTSDALSRLIKKGSINFGSNKDFGFAIKSLEIGSTLTAAELLSFAKFLGNVARVKAWGLREHDDDATDSLDDYFELLQPLTQVANEINRCILDEEGHMADDASPVLKSIRRNLSQTNDKIHSELNKMVNGSLSSYLQDHVVTMRNNRYCVPVKAEYKSSVNGMIHDQSATGATIFVEPQAIVELNNKIRELEIEEEKEIAVILAGLSAELSEHIVDLKTDRDFMTKLDFIFAKGSLALEQNATRPVFNDEKRINIRRGRHPLLDKKKVVPVDVPLGKDYDLLVITGPNTGGKTVTLKTVGLFTLMGQAGLHIPAGDRSELSIFTEVFADIGDEQSIEQSLSTFSSHMKSIVYILKHADADSLCLFDELGAGTDPTEGAALAIAILRFLHDRGIRSMATTHYSELKLFALSTDFVENACCEFDVETLSPTYRLLIGIPGKSNAFAISQKLGLSKDIIEAAKETISEDSEHFEDVIANLESSRVKMERDRAELDAKIAQYEQDKKSLEEKTEKLNESRDRILREANEEARDILAEAKEYADETIRIMQKTGTNISMKDLEARRQNLRGKMDDKNNRIAKKKDPKESVGVNAKDLRVGDMVKIVSMGLKGTVSSLPDSKGNLYVQCGIIRSTTNIKDIVIVQEEEITAPGIKKPSPQGSGAGKIKMSKAMNISYECNLIGKTVDEALAVLDKYLDDAYLSHMSQVRIVHGKGTGALRSAVQQHLRKCKYVASYRAGEHGEGDAGVTIVEFK